MELKVLLLHKHPKYILDTCHLINEEWKRSETARLRSLENSCDTLPTCLILLQDNTVIGHAKLSTIPSIKDSCFIESVVISKNLRGKGYGTYLMKKVEEFCKNELHLNSIHLSTKGQEKFYSKLGYIECQPISIYGSSISNQFEKSQFKCSGVGPKLTTNNCPKPPPLPNNVPGAEITQQKKTYMYKTL